MGFPLVQKSVTLNVFKRHIGHYFSLFCRIW